MITATFKEKDNRYYLSVNGHACYADKGQDIVCSSVSSLSIMVADEVLNRCDNAICKIEDGFLSCTVDLNEFDHAGSYHISSLFEMLESSLRDIEQQYPENIKVVVESE